MKHLLSLLVLTLLGFMFIGGEEGDAPGTTPLVDWVLVISKEAAHRVEPTNTDPRPMSRELARVFVKTTTDRHELALLTVYAFCEGAYSMDPSEPGDCKDENGLSLPPGTPKCTKKLVEAGRQCCSPEKAQHWCTLQVEPRPKTIEECVQRGSTIMRGDISKTCSSLGGGDSSPSCCAHPGSIYATGGSCVPSHRIDWRAKIAKHLEDMP